MSPQKQQYWICISWLPGICLHDQSDYFAHMYESTGKKKQLESSEAQIKHETLTSVHFRG